MRVQTYELIPQHGEYHASAIHCFVCGTTSVEVGHFEQKFCGRCGLFHEEMARRIESGMRKLDKQRQASRMLKRLATP